MLNCDLSWIYVPEPDTDKKMFYLAAEDTKKKVIQTPQGGYFCESSQRMYESAVPIYNFSVRISDCSGSLSMQCFGDVGEAMLGISSKDFLAMHEDHQAVKNLTMDRLHQTKMNICVRAKVDFGPNGQLVKYSAVRTGEHSYANHNQHLLDLLSAYKDQGMEVQTEVPNFF